MLNVLQDIVYLGTSFDSCSFHFIPRGGNVAADSLAKAALSLLLNSPLLE